ncbi:unnamed protein product [Enterobius vermicularis]|uniref:riboflavin kinase n=1 Tax=Enterobius vermicularis TaxID=51028 RepID=A0A0N4VI61_ENTVE|nr:unnamed protein product [Enterobius vermicularis]
MQFTVFLLTHWADHCVFVYGLLSGVKVNGCSLSAQNDNFADMSHTKFPYFFHGRVVPGHRRGSTELSMPTANLDDAAIARLPSDFLDGVYYGIAAVVSDGKQYGMLMSVGKNIHFNMEERTMEVHLLHQYSEQFYGEEVKGVVLGYLRPMLSFPNLKELIDAIRNDVDTAKNLLVKIDIENYNLDQ